MPKDLPHIFLPGDHESETYTAKWPGSDDDPLPPRIRKSHAEKLRKQWQAIWAKAKEEQGARTAVSMRTKDGVYVEFEGAPGRDLATKSLEDLKAGIRLTSVYIANPDAPRVEQTIRATVFIPAGEQNKFLKKVSAYANEDTPKGQPKNAPLVQSIEDIRFAVLESFWRDEIALLPHDDTAVWCELWVRTDKQHEEEGETVIEAEVAFREAALAAGIELEEHALRFPERTVMLGRATRAQLSEMLASSEHVAEFRRAKETARFFMESQNRDQTAWAEDLRKRLQVDPDTLVAVCVLDTGANNGHILLQPILADNDLHCVNPSWGVNDHHGHGTWMCGVSAFGDLVNALQGSGPVAVRHFMESAKILPPSGQNQPDLYGYVTIQGMMRAEIQAPDRLRIGCMAVTAEDGRDRGRPSSWSAAIDSLTSGYSDERKRLFIVSAGNCDDEVNWASYPEGNLTYEVHDPGQSWNALTVGAYTEKAVLTDPSLKDYTPLAKPGELSPFNSTSLSWESKWPLKPDIVLEGGNVARAPDGNFTESDELSLLTTGHQPTIRQFHTICATSAAAALAARMAAQIQAQYPDAWPETIRGLLIHSASWPDALKQQLLPAAVPGQYTKTDYRTLLRTCGYGVPSLNRALASASNSLTLISQAEIQPYEKSKMNEMHLYRLPWPREELLRLGELPVALRVTLSYFTEPGPGEIGWKDRYRYAGFSLRFDVNDSTESEKQFRNRLNVAARDEGETVETTGASTRWELGAQNRNKGSIHSDIWHSTAAQLATTNFVGVFPIVGWWRERTHLNRYNQKARYSLIVSLETPEETVDIYTPVAVQLGIPIEITT